MIPLNPSITTPVQQALALHPTNGETQVFATHLRENDTTLTAWHFCARPPHGACQALLASDGVRLVEARRANALLGARKAGIAYPEVPPVEVLSLLNDAPPHRWCNETSMSLSAGVVDPILERAREVHAFEDYKGLSDLRVKPLTPQEVAVISADAQRLASRAPTPQDAEKVYLRHYIEGVYEQPHESVPTPEGDSAKWRVQSGDSRIDNAFAYTEATWGKLLRTTRPAEGGSLLPAPYPILVPAGRFQEQYYWDTYFAIKGLLATGRLRLAQMQVENMLSYARNYGRIPNGGRDYLLSRSQPPFVSSMVREVYEASLARATTPAQRHHLETWLRERAFPLVRHDYEDFWMNPDLHLDVATGLNHHCDDVNLPRPERHGADDELTLGVEYRDTRAAAESGFDFTDAFNGEATHVAGPLLNAMLYKTEIGLAWMAERLHDAALRERFEAAAEKRQQAMNKYLWNKAEGRFESYHLARGIRMGILAADTFTPLFVGLATDEQAAAVMKQLPRLEREGGIMASELTKSLHQWDGTNGWAPLQVMAIQGARQYGYREDARRLAAKWVGAIANVHAKTGTMYERLDVVHVARPENDAHKYPTQEGFLWTNGSFAWATVEVLGHALTALSRGLREPIYCT